MTTPTLSRLSGKWVEVSSPGDHVALVQLSRNPVNAFHQAVWEELGYVFSQVSEESSVRVVVLASALPKLFSAGIDVSALEVTVSPDSDPARHALHMQKVVTSFQAAISAIERCPYPVIVATHGVTFGLSIDIITACDVRYAASNSIFAIKEVDVGLAADIGTLARLPKIAGNHSLVHELSYTGRNFSAAEAEKMGLVSCVIDGGRDEVVTAALATAKVIATKSPIAVLGTKHLLLHARDHTVRENLEYTAVWNSAMLQTEDIPEALNSFRTKQPPRYKPIGAKL